MPFQNFQQIYGIPEFCYNLNRQINNTYIFLDQITEICVLTFQSSKCSQYCNQKFLH